MNLKLVDFYNEFYYNLDKIERQNILFDELTIKNKELIYHIILLDNIEVGLVGFLKAKFSTEIAFVQIFIKKEYRGLGILKKAEDLLAKQYKLHILFATIDINNIASYKSHLKAGFVELSAMELNKLRKMGKLENTQTRLKKIYF